MSNLRETLCLVSLGECMLHAQINVVLVVDYHMAEAALRLHKERIVHAEQSWNIYIVTTYFNWKLMKREHSQSANRRGALAITMSIYAIAAVIVFVGSTL